MVNKDPDKKLMVCVPILIEWSRIQDLLCCALEGGSNYWYMIEEFHEPTSMPIRTDEREVFKHLDYPVNPGGSLVFSDLEEGHKKKERFTLNRQSIEKGLTIMADKYPRHFADFQAENDDAITGDVFLQCCLFGEACYG